jgi:hypothetical protein
MTILKKFQYLLGMILGIGLGAASESGYSSQGDMETQQPLPFETINIQGSHPICEKLCILDVDYEDGANSESRKPSFQPLSSDQRTDLTHLVDRLTEIFSNKDLFPLFNEVNKLLEETHKHIIFTMGKDVAVPKLKEYLFSQQLGLTEVVNCVHMTLNKNALEESWVYTVNSRRNLEITPQPAFMVIAHELLHVVQNLLGEEVKLSTPDELYPYIARTELGDDKIKVKVRSAMPELWTQSTEVGVIVVLKVKNTKAV